ncbi:MAG: hypothetical protein ACRCXZ_02060 [Patescibacteria group bacterium]
MKFDSRMKSVFSLAMFALVGLTTPTIAHAQNKPTADPNKEAKESVQTAIQKAQSLNYSTIVCGQKQFNLGNQYIAAKNKSNDQVLNPEDYRPVSRMVKTQLAIGVMIASTESKLSKESRLHLGRSLVGLYTDVNDPHDVRFSKYLSERLGTLNFQNIKCEKPSVGMEYIRSAFENARIYVAWQQEYRMFQLKKKLDRPAFYPNRR